MDRTTVTLDDKYTLARLKGLRATRLDPVAALRYE